VQVWDITGPEPRERAPQATPGGHAFFLRDGKTLVESCTAENALRVWGLSGAAPAERAALSGHTKGLRAAVCFSDRRWCYSCDTNHTVRLWGLTGLPPQERLAFRDATWVRLAEERELLATGDKAGDLHIWDLRGEAPKEIATMRGVARSLSALELTRDGRLLAAAQQDGSVHLWDLTATPPREGGVLEGVPQADRQKGLESRLVFSRDGFRLLVWRLWWNEEGKRAEHSQGVWDLRGKGPRWRELRSGELSPDECVALSADGAHLALTAGSDVQVWGLSGDTPAHRATLQGHVGALRGLDFSADGKTLTTWGDHTDRTIRRWDLTARVPREIDKRPWPGGQIWAKEDGELLLAVEEEEIVRAGFMGSEKLKPFEARRRGPLSVWTRGGEKVCEWRAPGTVQDWDVAPDGRHLAVTLDNGTVAILRLWGPDAADRLIAACDAMLKRDPCDAEALLGRGRAHRLKGRLDQALADLTTAAHLRPGDARVWHERGLAHADKGDFVAAKRDLAEAVRLDPQLAPAPKGK
jgi:WD40 repeat protein